MCALAFGIACGMLVGLTDIAASGAPEEQTLRKD